MTSLPSFVELVASLGPKHTLKNPDQLPKSSLSSPSTSPRVSGANAPLHSRSKSTQSLKETTRPRAPRYFPYSPILSASRRSSMSSISSTSGERERSSLRAISSSPRSATSRGTLNKLSVNVYDSSSDLAANTPISSYVRRKTPGLSPTSPTFSQESRDSPPVSPIPVTLPTLPSLWPGSASSESFPITPNDSDLMSFESDDSFAQATKSHIRRRQHAGTRISTPPGSLHYPRRRSLARIA